MALYLPGTSIFKLHLTVPAHLHPLSDVRLEYNNCSQVAILAVEPNAMLVEMAITDFFGLLAASEEMVRIDFLSVPHLVDQLKHPQGIDSHEGYRVMHSKLFEGFQNRLNLRPPLIVPQLEFSIALSVILAAVVNNFNCSMKLFLNYLLPQSVTQFFLLFFRFDEDG